MAPPVASPNPAKSPRPCGPRRAAHHARQPAGARHFPENGLASLVLGTDALVLHVPALGIRTRLALRIHRPARFWGDFQTQTVGGSNLLRPRRRPVGPLFH